MTKSWDTRHVPSRKTERVRACDADSFGARVRRVEVKVARNRHIHHKHASISFCARRNDAMCHPNRSLLNFKVKLLLVVKNYTVRYQYLMVGIIFCNLFSFLAIFCRLDHNPHPFIWFRIQEDSQNP